jgi:hypothetical protein
LCGAQNSVQNLLLFQYIENQYYLNVKNSNCRSEGERAVSKLIFFELLFIDDKLL